MFSACNGIGPPETDTNTSSGLDRQKTTIALVVVFVTILLNRT